MIELKLIKPVDAPINERAGKWGDPRANGRTHRGIDYLAPKGTTVRASERGKVVRAVTQARRPWKTLTSRPGVEIKHHRV